MTTLPTPYFTDFQPYLLPNTDPWSLPNDKALTLLKRLEQKGIRQVFCTPPVKEENSRNSTEFLQKVFEGFCMKYKGNVEFKLAARYRMDGAFDEYKKGNKLLAIGKERGIIIDASPLKATKDFWEKLRVLRAEGYTPAFIQPERISYWNEEHFALLREHGCKLILNLYSLFGYNGDYALMYSRELLSQGKYDYLFSGMEDTKTMGYSENFMMDQGDILLKELIRLEENGRLLWAATEIR